MWLAGLDFHRGNCKSSQGLPFPCVKLYAGNGLRQVRLLTVVDENRFCAAEGDSGDAASVGRANGLPALASSSKDSTCAKRVLRVEPIALYMLKPIVLGRLLTRLCDSAIDSHCKKRLSSFSLLMGNLA